MSNIIEKHTAHLKVNYSIKEMKLQQLFIIHQRSDLHFHYSFENPFSFNE